MKGLFITFEGVEGAGKTTQLGRFVDLLRKKGCEHVVTREPGGTDFSEAVRKILLDKRFKGMDPVAELYLYCASRRQHVEDVIRPALEDDKIVVCDRYGDATLAYQCGGRGLDYKMVERVHSWAAGGVEPSLTFLIDCDPAVGLSRVGSRSEADRMESEKLDFHRRVRKLYLEIARRNEERVIVIDGSKDENKVWEEVLNNIKKRVTCLKV